MKICTSLDRPRNRDYIVTQVTEQRLSTETRHENVWKWLVHQQKKSSGSFCARTLKNSALTESTWNRRFIKIWVFYRNKFSASLSLPIFQTRFFEELWPSMAEEFFKKVRSNGPVSIQRGSQYPFDHELSGHAAHFQYIFEKQMLELSFSPRKSIFKGLSTNKQTIAALYCQH